MTRIIDPRTDSEPDRLTILRDDDGEFWQYSEGDQGWYWTNHPSNDRPNSVEFAWAEIKHMFTDIYPFTVYTSVPVAESPGQGFQVKDSGERQEYSNGFVRDTETGKPDYSVAIQTLARNPELLTFVNTPGVDLLPCDLLIRWAEHMDKGAQKYGRDNWRQARGLVAKARFARSLLRHTVQLLNGEQDEDHAAAVMFNVSAYVKTPAEDLET